jgi:hypothetical protein
VTNVFRRGDRVIARFDSGWYPGVIEDVEPNGNYKVKQVLPKGARPPLSPINTGGRHQSFPPSRANPISDRPQVASLDGSSIRRQ